MGPLLAAARLANKADPEIQTLLKSNEKSFPLERSADEWQTLRLSVSSNTLTARVDGKEIGSFTSEGFAHDTKAEIRINVPSQAWLDDVRIWKVN